MAAIVYKNVYAGSPGTSTTPAGDGILLATDTSAKLLSMAAASGGAGYSYSGSYSGSGDGGVGGDGMYFQAGGHLNNFGSITGGDGGQAALSSSLATDGGDGGIGVRLELADKVYNHGAISGGTGGQGGEGNSSVDGSGGTALALISGGFVINSGDITGGTGAGDNGGFLIFPAGGPVGGTGGDGIYLGAKGVVKNHGSVSGGAGGYGGYKNGGGVGGVGIEVLQAGVVKNTNFVTGGEGAQANFQGKGGTGGAGILLDQGGNTGRVVNTKHATIMGGTGGPGPSYSTYFILDTGGAGGDGVDGPAGGELENHGTIVGGAGGSPTGLLIIPDNTTAVGGAGVSITGGGFVHNSGTITGGEGGSNGGAGGAGEIVGGGKNADQNGGVITGGDGQGVLLGILAPAVGGVGVEMTGAGKFVNNGLISAGFNAAAGMQFDSGSSTLVNNGTIAGSVDGVAVSFGGGGGDHVIIDSHAKFTGRVEAAGSNNVVELTGTSTGSLVNPEDEFTGFQTFEVAGGANWSLTGSVGSLVNDGTVDLHSAALDVTGAVNANSTGDFLLTGKSSLEIASLLGSSTQIDFAGTTQGESLIVDDPSKFGSGSGTAYAGPLLEDFGAGDSIDLKGIGFLGLHTNYNSTTGLLQVSNAVGGVVASLDFQTASLGAGGFHLTTDLTGGSVLTRS